MALLRTVCVAVLLVCGAAGLSSLRGDDYCSENHPAGFAEGSSAETRLSAWPLGWACAYEDPHGRTATVSPADPAGFLAALAAGGLVWWHRARLRAAWAATLAFAVLGVGGLLGGWLLAVFLGYAVGVPLAYLATRSLWRALAAAAALFVANVFWLLGAGTPAFGIPLLALVALGLRSGGDAPAVRAA